MICGVVSLIVIPSPSTLVAVSIFFAISPFSVELIICPSSLFSLLVSSLFLFVSRLFAFILKFNNYNQMKVCAMKCTL